jgi:hypothetical protein
MKRGNKTYSFFNLASAAFMIVALLWLTVSIAFIYPAQQELAQQDTVENAKSCASSEEDDCDPFGNTNEEKASGSNTSFSEEYLHDHHASDHFISTVSKMHSLKNHGTYNAFHGEVHVPPPNIA